MTVGLARSHADEPLAAWARRSDLVRAARALVLAGGHDPDRAPCSGAGCRLGALAAADRCVLAHRLAELSLTERGPHAVPRLDAAADRSAAPAALARFDAALAGALDAVRLCRQTAHPVGACWFTATPGTDGCAEVLRVAHRCC